MNACHLSCAALRRGGSSEGGLWKDLCTICANVASEKADPVRRIDSDQSGFHGTVQVAFQSRGLSGSGPGPARMSRALESCGEAMRDRHLEPRRTASSVEHKAVAESPPPSTPPPPMSSAPLSVSRRLAAVKRKVLLVDDSLSSLMIQN